MKTLFTRVAVAVVIVFAAAQAVRPNRTNPPTDPSRSIQAHAADSALIAVVDRSCRDCHSNNTVWPWYTQVAPVSWLMASGVTQGRKALNFSEWSAYPPDLQRALLSASCADATSGKMPGIYARIRPETKLSQKDVDIICAAAHLSDSRVSAQRSQP